MAKKKTPRMTKAIESRIKQMRKAGSSIQDIADATGFSKAAVFYACRRLGIKSVARKKKRIVDRETTRLIRSLRRVQKMSYARISEHLAEHEGVQLSREGVRLVLAGEKVYPHRGEDVKG